MAEYEGDNRNNLYIGTDESDLINGHGAIDLLRGGAGDDTINGGNGPDSLYGDQGADTINGGDGDDLIRGGKGNDTLDGGAGRDVVRGDLGDDLIFARGDGDVIDGGPGRDTVDYRDAPGAVAVLGLAVAETIPPSVPSMRGNLRQQPADFVGDDLLDDVEIYRGSAHDDLMFVDFQRDVDGIEVYGADGDDLLIARGSAVIDGGTGDDSMGIRSADGAVLTGGAGSDRFLFSERVASATITDFTSGEDTITLHSSLGEISADGVQAMLDGSEGETLNLTLLGDDIAGMITLTGIDVSDLTVADFGL